MAAKRYSEQFKREALELLKVSGKSIPEIAPELGVSEQSLRNWVNRARGEASGEVLSEDERAELRALRRENRTLKMEREILKKAAAFFAKETDGR